MQASQRFSYALLLVSLAATVALAGCRSESSSPSVSPAVITRDAFVGPYQTIVALELSGRMVSIPLLFTSDGVGAIEASLPVELGGMSPSPTPTPSGPTLQLVYEDRADGTMTLFGEIDGVARHPFARGAISQDGRIVAWSHVLTTDFFPPGMWIGMDTGTNTAEATLQGDYHFVAMSVDTSVPLDRGQVGRWVFDGIGGYTIEDVVTNDAGVVGPPISSPWLYTYGIPDEGLVTLAGENRIWLGSVLGDGGLGAFSDITTAPSTSLLLTLAFCLPVAPSATTSTVNGSYHFVGLSYNGATFRSHVGQLEADGLGNLTGTVIENDDGYTSPPAAVTATYTVGADGVFTLSPNPGDSFQGGVSATGDLVIMGGGTSAFVDRGIWLMFRR